MTTKCLITGCRLIVPDEGKSLWGDLHCIDLKGAPRVYIFNGVSTLEKPLWDYREPPVGEKQITVGEYFERKGVIVFMGPHFNGAAVQYLNGD